MLSNSSSVAAGATPEDSEGANRTVIGGIDQAQAQTP